MIGFRSRRQLPEDVPFPVTPMLDMAFQLLAFFVLTFQAPTREARLDLYLPTTPVALPGSLLGEARSIEPTTEADLETDLPIRAEADAGGKLRTLKLGGTILADIEALETKVRRYNSMLEGRPLRILLLADDSLNYEEAARIVGACSRAGIASIRLGDPKGRGR